MEKIECGMYVRTEYGIAKIIKISDDNLHCDNTIMKSFGENFYSWDIPRLNIMKAKYNIDEVLEVGDILLLFDKEYNEKYKAEVVLNSEDFKSIVNYEQTDLLNLEYELITEEHIKLLSIVTKEQFESMQYRLGD